jgi:hypothetical protein
LIERRDKAAPARHLGHHCIVDHVARLVEDHDICVAALIRRSGHDKPIRLARFGPTWRLTGDEPRIDCHEVSRSA